MLDGSEGAATLPRVLHVGCGGETLAAYDIEGIETRLDIDPRHKPDIVASMTDIPADVGGFDAVFCFHALEHLYPHEVPVALANFLRVLRPGGAAIVVVPDLSGVMPTDEVLYDSPAGPVAGLDLYYGMRRLIPTMPFMAHHMGFLPPTLAAALSAAGFERVSTRRGYERNLTGYGYRP